MGLVIQAELGQSEGGTKLRIDRERDGFIVQYSLVVVKAKIKIFVGFFKSPTVLLLICKLPFGL